MKTLAERLLEHGIRPRKFSEGNSKMLCPQCSHKRANKTDPCLSLTIDRKGATWDCHHCQWKGGFVEQNDTSPARRRDTPKPQRPKHKAAEPNRAMLDWLYQDRGISEAVARRNRLELTRAWFPQLEAEAECIAFPYLRKGETIAAKYRTFPVKHFTQAPGCEKILYGLDDIADSKVAIIVEGELDKLAIEQAGIRHVVSVPNGAPAKVKDDPSADDTNFSYLAACAEYLAPLEKIILAGDSDSNGGVLETELARRLGRERCWRVRWPDSGDAPCKDANETLLVHGAAAVLECIASAEPYPIAGLHSVSDYAAETIELFRDGVKRGHSTGWFAVDDLYKVREGELTIVTGVPGSGKSEWLDAIMVNLAQSFGWRFGLCSFENAPPEHIAKLAEKHLGLPFWDGPTMRMAERDLSRAIEWANDHFTMIRADDETPTIDWILDTAKAAVLRHGIRGLVVDPYNEIEHQRPNNMSETEYVSRALGKVKRFARNSGVHVWFVAHPAKPIRDGNSKPGAPTLYDISGSANWINKADFGIVVHRPDPHAALTEIHVRKVRSKAFGKLGTATLRYDRATGQYADPQPTGRRAWADD